MPAAVILLWLRVMSVWLLPVTAMTILIDQNTTQKALFLRLTVQTIVSLSLSPGLFDSDTETKYVLTWLLRL